MEGDAATPAEVRDILASVGGVATRLEGGLSASHVFELRVGGSHHVLKIQRDRREYTFYTVLAPALLPRSPWLATITDHGIEAGWNWLLLEYLPGEFPRERFSFDNEALSILRSLHATEVGTISLDSADDGWTETQLLAACRVVDSATAERLSRVHRAFNDPRDQLPPVLCSGDPNVPNWRLRTGGDLVLIDWQQLTLANPALDLAGWIASMPTFADIERVVGMYLGPSRNTAHADLSQHVARWFVRRCAMNFWRAEQSPHPGRWQAGNERTRAALPAWLSALERDAGWA